MRLFVCVLVAIAGCGRSEVDVFARDAASVGDTGELPGDDDAPADTLSASVIPPGSFTMGSPPSEACREPWDEKETAHEVTLSYAYTMLDTEVTQGQWMTLMATFPAAQAVACDTCPVVNVTWHDAASFCNALSAREGRDLCYACDAGECAATGDAIACTGWRLPTEAEWERARRAGTTGSLYATDVVGCGSDAGVDEVAWYLFNTPGTTQTVQPTASKPANAFGLHDMAGNAWEWCEDWDQNDLGAAAVTDPLTTTNSGFRVARGGGFSDRAEILRAAMRDSNRPNDRFDYVGFRCARRR